MKRIPTEMMIVSNILRIFAPPTRQIRSTPAKCERKVTTNFLADQRIWHFLEKKTANINIFNFF